MLTAQIYDYISLIEKEKVKQFLMKDNLSSEEWKEIYDLILKVEIQLCQYFRTIFSKGKILDESKDSFIFQGVFSNMQNLKNQTSYEINNSKMHPGIYLWILIFIREINLNHQNITQFMKIYLKKTKKFIKIYKNCEIIQLDQILTPEELQGINSDILNLEFLQFLSECVAFIFQSSIIGEFAGNNTCKYVMLEKNLGNSSVETFIKQEILSGNLPGPFIKIDKIINQDHRLEITFSFGGKILDLNTKYIIKYAIRLLILYINSPITEEQFWDFLENLQEF